MRKLITAVILLASVSTASADDCGGIAKLGEAIMKAHQYGIPLQTLLTKMDGIITEPAMREAVSQMAASVYLTPRFSTESFRQNAIDEFRDRTHATCLAW